MIFITVGTEQFPLDRLVRALDEACARGEIGDSVFAQIGVSQYRPGSFDYTEFIGFDLMIEKMKSARVVVSHAGAGTTLLALSLGKIPIIFPRRLDNKEHVDDHQMEFSKRMEKARRLIVAYDEKDLVEKIKNYDDHVKRLKVFQADEENELASYLMDLLKGWA